MNEGWIVFGIVVLVLLGASLPLLRQAPPSRQTPEQKQPGNKQNTQ